MKFILIAMGLSTTLVSSAAVLGPTDDRVEMYELPADWQPMAEATIAIAHSKNISNIRGQWKTFTESYTLATSPHYNPPVHPNHRYANQGPISYCSAFLINPDTIVTAAHCLPESGNMSELDYAMAVAGMGYRSADILQKTPLMFDLGADHVSRIDSRVLYAGKPTGSDGNASETDFAILKLKSPLFNITPVKLQRGFSGEYKTPIAILGYPIGLPLKGDLNGQLAAKTEPGEKILKTFFDSSGGNSGGPVFDRLSHGVVGLLVASGQDWVGCESSGDYLSSPKYWCEARRPETVDQLASDPKVPRKLVAQFLEKYPDGVITAWASRVLRIDQVMDKLDELKIPYSELK